MMAKKVLRQIIIQQKNENTLMGETVRSYE